MADTDSKDILNKNATDRGRDARDASEQAGQSGEFPEGTTSGVSETQSREGHNFIVSSEHLGDRLEKNDEADAHRRIFEQLKPQPHTNAAAGEAAPTGSINDTLGGATDKVNPDEKVILAGIEKSPMTAEDKVGSGTGQIEAKTLLDEVNSWIGGPEQK